MATVSTVSNAFCLQRRDMQLTHNLMGGTQAMLRAGTEYIPQGKTESIDEYTNRLKRTVLLNAYRRTVRFCRGQLFKKPVVIEDHSAEDLITQELTEWFKTWSEDVNRNGENLNEWSGDVFETSLNDGVTFVLVDYSAVPLVEDSNGRLMYEANGELKPKTAQADQENNWGPYLIHIKAEQVIDIRVSAVDGVQRVTHLRYIENFEEPDGEWETKTRQRIKVFTQDGWETWENETDGSDAFEKKASGPMLDETGQKLPYVPLAIFMPGDRRTAVTAEPPLQDLAELNKRHWQATCSQTEMMEFARRPVWFGRQLGDPSMGQEAQIEFGPGRLINASSDMADLRSLGIDSASVAAGRQELVDLESQMAMYGLQLLQPKNGAVAVTATEVTQDTEESMSTLQEWAVRFQNFLENVLQLVALWKAEPDGPSVKVNTDFAKPINFEFLLQLFRAGILSKQSFLELMVQAGVLPDDFNIEMEIDKLAQEVNTHISPSGQLNLSNLVNRGRQIGNNS